LGIISRYLRWLGHDAGGTLPPEDVLVGILTDGVWRLPSSWRPLEPGETLVYVPPQWIGDWETGHRLAPGYQHVWRVPLTSLCPLCPPQSLPHLASYRPSTLPASATGPTARPKWVRSRRETSLQTEETRLPKSRNSAKSTTSKPG
jgi:hypothetical protein